MKTNLESIIGTDEKIIYKGKPDKKCYILESIFNPLLFFAIIWAFVDGFAISKLINDATEEIGFLVPFFLIHLMPVWLYLITVILCFLSHSRVNYIITDKGVYISGGLFSFSYQMKPFTEICSISMHRGIFDQLCKCGDVVFDTPIINQSNSSKRSNDRLAIINIHNYEEVFKIVKQLQTDIYSDTMYPNDLRPKTNHGYNTEYKNDNENGTK